MESGNELSKTVATFILQKILLDEAGLNYICQTYDRFSHVAMILGKMVLSLAKEPSARLLKHVVRCYLRLSDNSRLASRRAHKLAIEFNLFVVRRVLSSCVNKFLNDDWLNYVSSELINVEITLAVLTKLFLRTRNHMINNELD